MGGSIEIQSEIRDFRFDGYDASLKSCYYCGEPADTTDHVPPQCIRPLMLRDPVGFKQYKFCEVDCCKECNSGLGKRFWTLAERKNEVAKRIRRKYKKLLEMPDWTVAELATVSSRMRDQILSQLKRRGVARRRLSWASPKLARTVSLSRVAFRSQRRRAYSYYNSPVETKMCKKCGASFKTANPRQIYCLSRHPAPKRVEQKKKCAKCGKVFKSANPNKKYCQPYHYHPKNYASTSISTTAPYVKNCISCDRPFETNHAGKVRCEMWCRRDKIRPLSFQARTSLCDSTLGGSNGRYSDIVPTAFAADLARCHAN
jgi:hypothetical protein